ncbi:hypothetical protein KGM_208195 [Danaus plexippus plexippus]|uniref:Uncharacterized protein n=1 Tax=Danaus plexippus plexippus TaxID=278856 RepID=A0A212FEA9_DANPL|nr:hypothetical protein KGM_208195 [Danaus plexippus plexippus]
MLRERDTRDDETPLAGEEHTTHADIKHSFNYEPKANLTPDGSQRGVGRGLKLRKRKREDTSSSGSFRKEADKCEDNQLGYPADPA